MPNPNKTRQPDLYRSEQSALNRSFDDEFDVLAVEQLGYNGSALVRQPTLQAGLVTAAYDYISIPSYDANNNPLTIIYKSGGASGTTVATLTITYSGTLISSVART